MMKIQEGKVRYNGRDDIVCLYGETEDGKQYYFIKDLLNGNRIVSTALVEAIDPMYKPSNIGVIDAEGIEKISCNNKAVKQVPDHEDILLVEPATVVSENVVEAIQLRNDPLSATRLVSTPSTIKEKMNSKMGTEGRYIFNDQFSEATIYDLDGNNLANGEYYSFIGYANNELYLAKNTIDTEVVELSLTKENEVVNEVNNTEGFGSEDVSQITLGEDQLVSETVPTESIVNPAEEAQPEETPVETQEIVDSGMFSDVSAPVQEEVNVPQEEVPVEAVNAPVEENVPVVEETVSEPLGQEITIPTVEEETSNDLENITFDPTVLENTENEDTNQDVETDEPVEEFVNDIDVERENTELDNLFFNTNNDEEFEDIKVDKIENEEDYFEPEQEEVPQDSVIEEVTKTISNLIQTNKDLEEKNRDLESKNKDYREENKKLRMVVKKDSGVIETIKKTNDAYKAREYGFKSQISKLEKEVDKLRRENANQKAVLDKHDEDNKALIRLLDNVSMATDGNSIDNDVYDYPEKRMAI